MLTGYTREFKANLQLAYPIILGLIGHAFIGIVDKIMVGQLGTAELAAVSLGNSFVFIAMSVGIGFSTAITPIIGEAHAANRQEVLKSTFLHGLKLCTLIGIALFGMVYFSKPIMHWMGQPEEVIALAGPYLDLVGFSLIPMIIYQGYKQFADGLSLTKYSLYAILLANIVHVPLNYAFIYGWGFIPAWGVTGAAVGTLASRVAMVLFMHYRLKSRHDLVPVFQNWTLGITDWPITRKLLKLGFPSGMQMLFEVGLFTSAVWITGFLGTASQAANEIALSIATLTFMFASGISVSTMVRVSNQRGLDNYPQLIRSANASFVLVLLVMGFFALCFIGLHQHLPRLFVDSKDAVNALHVEEVVQLASRLLLIAAFFQLFDGLQAVVLGALRGLQDVTVPMYLVFFSYWAIGFPVSYGLGLYTELGAMGVWVGLAVGLAIASLFLYLRFNYISKKMAAKQAA